MSELQAGFGMVPFNLPGLVQTTDGTPLVARCLILDDGRTRLALVSGTYLMLGHPETDAVRDAVAQATGLARSAVLLAGTHVHSGPPTLASDRATRQHCAGHIATAAASAARRAVPLTPVRFGFATDHLPGISRVRRILRRDGTVMTLRRAWPQTWGWATDPETVGPEEPLDDLLTVLRFEDAGGRLLGAVLHFTCHPLPDFLGYAAALVEKSLPGTVCLVFNGCQGSVDTPFEVPLRGRTQAAQLPVLGDILAYRTLELLARAETAAGITVDVASRPVLLPVDPRFHDNPVAQWGLFADSAMPDRLEAEVQCIRLGGLVLAGIPGEAHVGFGTELAGVSPFRLTRAIGIANRSCGYLFPAAARARGGYEADPSYWGIVTGQGIVEILAAARACLADLAARADAPCRPGHLSAE
jgi:hypothetical protein